MFLVGKEGGFSNFLKQNFCRYGGTFVLQKELLETTISELRAAQP